MKKTNSTLLLETMKEETRAIIFKAEQLKKLSPELLVKKMPVNAWSVAQILDHLNIYCRFYITAIEKKLHHDTSSAAIHFTPGWLGNYFTRIMRVDNGTIKTKMKAPANAVPAAAPDPSTVLQEFIDHQYQLLTICDIARKHNINTLRIPTSLSKLIQLKLGDTLRFFSAHQQRHFLQINNILKQLHTQPKMQLPVEL